MAARSQPVGLRGCRETMSAAGRQKTNITPPATSGGKGRRSSEVGTLVRVRGGAAALSPPHTAPNGPGQKPASASASRLSDGSTVRPDADYFVYCALAVVGKVEIGDPDAGPEQRSTAHYSRGLHPPWGGLPVSTVTLARASPG